MLSRMTRKQIIELLETVREGIVCPNMNERAAMLDECIAALSVSQNICKKELVAERFAQYKDTMDTMTAALGQMKESPAEEITALSLQLLDWLLGELKNEKVKKEIVFLPYKASMWDSLESIWRAAAEDSEHCNAYVVPIPYADLTKEHTVKEWHCEIELFPKDVPVLDFRQVDLEKMHPDVIFIHNPYDYANYVTSVDSHYYSSELKKYTDKLVYVPYFVIGNNLPPHFAQAPGVVNADYVIVESEEIKEQYERYYPGGNPPEGKFLALGSPKYDKVLSAKREDYELPERWQKLLNGRKSILYNTGVSAVLQNRDTYLKKVRSVFDTFKQRDDVVLWWRPHPLLEATFDSMVPEQAEEYRQLREEYIQAGWGIYDDSPELERAIIWTDAYYGDQSSVVWMYQATGKKILIQNVFAIDGMKNVNFYNMVKDGENFYFADYCQGKISRFNLVEKKINTIAYIPEKYRQGPYAYGTLAKVGTKFLVAPLCENRIIEYEEEMNEFREGYVLQNEYMNAMGAVIQSVHYKNKVYFIACRSNEIVEYNEITKKYTSLKDWFALVEPHISNANSEIMDMRDLLHSSCQHGQYLFFAIPQGNLILQLDMETDGFVLHRIGDVSLRFQNLTIDGDVLWILCVNGSILRWDLKDNSIRIYREHLNILGLTNKVFTYGDIVASEGKVYLLPLQAHQYTVLDQESGDLLENKECDGNGIIVYRGEDTFAWLETAFPKLMPKGNQLHWNRVESEQCEVSLSYDDESVKSIVGTGTQLENCPCTLLELFHGIASSNENKMDGILSGSEIYHVIC